MSRKNPIADLDMNAPPLTPAQRESAKKKLAAKLTPSPTDRELIVTLIRLAGRDLSPSTIQDVFSGNDKKRRTEIHREITRMIDDGTVGITLDWCLRLRSGGAT